MDWSSINWELVIMIVLGLIALVMSGMALQFFRQLQRMVKALDSFLQAVIDALADGSITQEEAVRIRDSWLGLLAEGASMWVVMKGIWAIIRRIKELKYRGTSVSGAKVSYKIER